MSDVDLLLRTHLFISKKIMRDAFKRHAPRLTGRCLDAGCGYQPYKSFLTNVTQYISLEFSRKLKPSVVGDVQRLPFADGSFDSALCQEVIEHVPEPGMVLAELYRVVKPGGIIYLTAPMSWNLHYEPYDFWRFTRYGLTYLAERANLEVLTIERLGGFWALWGARCADNLGTLLKRLCKFLPKPARHALVIGATLPINLVFYALSVAFDRLEQSEAKGWLVLLRRPDDHGAMPETGEQRAATVGQAS